MWVPQTDFYQFDTSAIDAQVAQETSFTVTYWLDSSITGDTKKIENAVKAIGDEVHSNIRVEPNLNDFDVSLVLKVDETLKKQAQINLMPGGNKVQIIFKSMQKIPKDFSLVMRRILRQLGSPIDAGSS